MLSVTLQASEKRSPGSPHAWEGGSGLYPKRMQLALHLPLPSNQRAEGLGSYVKDPRSCYCRKRKDILSFHCLAAT